MEIRHRKDSLPRIQATPVGNDSCKRHCDMLENQYHIFLNHLKFLDISIDKDQTALLLDQTNQAQSA